MYFTKYILPETEIFATKLLRHEETSKSSTYNIPNFTNPLVSHLSEGNDTFIFKESTSQPGVMDFVEAMRKEKGTHEIDKHWNLVRRRELNG